jgi:hypothetical protein
VFEVILVCIEISKWCAQRAQEKQNIILINNKNLIT